MKLKSLAYTFLVALLLSGCIVRQVPQKEIYESSTKKTFTNPTFKDGMGVDVCKTWGNACGKPAADLFCKNFNYSYSSNHSIQNNTPPTRIMTSGKVCNKSFCDRFSSITCVK